MKSVKIDAHAVTPLPEHEKDEFLRYLTSSLKCTVSPGESKEDKLTAIARKLIGPGLVLAPDDEQVAHITDCLESGHVGIVSMSLAAEPEENRAAIESCLAGEVKVLVAEQPCSENLPPIPFRYIVHWSLPQSLQEYLHAFRYFATSGNEKFAVLLYNPADRYHQEEFIKRKYGTGPLHEKHYRESLSSLDIIDEYASTGGCRIQFIKKVFDLEQDPGECGNCDNCKKSIAEKSRGAIDTDKSRVLLRCIVETREKFGVHILSDIVLGTNSKRIQEYKLARASTFGALRDTNRKVVKQLFDILIRHGYLKRTAGSYPTLYLTSFGKKLLGTTPVHPLELPKRMTVQPGEQLDAALVETVRNYRRAQAKLLNIPAFMVFSDAVLMNVVKKCPQSEKELKSISGFGETTWRICGEGLLKVVRTYAADTR